MRISIERLHFQVVGDKKEGNCSGSKEGRVRLEVG